MAQVRTREDVRQMCFQMSNTTQKEKWFLIKWFRRFDDETNNGGYRTEEIVGSQITSCLKSLV